MAKQKKYVFRGTTIGYAGNRSLIENEFTPTTRHPAIALLFAKECALAYPDSAIIYVARYNAVKELEKAANVVKKHEHEFVVGVPPKEFVKYTEGYISYKDLQAILTELGYDVSETVRKEKLTELCKKFKEITVEKLDQIMQLVESKLKTT